MHNNLYFLLAIVLLLPGHVSGATEPVITPAEPLSRELITPGSIVQLLVGLVVVVLAILVVAWLVRRMGALPAGQGQLKVVAGLALGQRERIVLVQIGDAHQVLLGVTAGHISCLGEFDQPVVCSQGGRGEFADKLRSVLDKKQGKPGS